MANPRLYWVSTLRSILIGFGFFVLGSVSELWLQQHTHRHVIALTMDTLLAMGVGILVLIYERRRRKTMIRELEVIRLMNHHVRNSLQVISFAASTPEHEELGADIRRAVERIDWALREVLPGQREDISTLLFRDELGNFRHKYESNEKGGSPPLRENVARNGAYPVSETKKRFG